jgi:hypothetical protein
MFNLCIGMAIGALITLGATYLFDKPEDIIYEEYISKRHKSYKFTKSKLEQMKWAKIKCMISIWAK